MPIYVYILTAAAYILLGIYVGIRMAAIYYALYGDELFNDKVNKVREARLKVEEARLKLETGRFETVFMGVVSELEKDEYVKIPRS